MKPATIIFFLCTLLLPHISSASEFRWPKVRPLNKIFHFNRPEAAHIEMDILGENRNVLYRMSCYTGENIDWGKVGFEYVGTLHCRVKDLSGLTHTEDLLNEDALAGKPWISRGRMLEDEIRGACATYPEYGSVRHFRFRGMVLTLSFLNTQFNAGRLAHYSLNIQVDPNEGVLTAQAEPPAYKYPKALSKKDERSDCSHVQGDHVLGKVSPEYIRSNNLEPPYPVILPTQATAKFVRQSGYLRYSTSADNVFTVPVRDLKGSVVYRFRCESFNGYWATAMITECGLFLPSSKVNLLSDGIDPYSGFSPNVIEPFELDESCAKYPSWGAKREFHLRHMKIKLWFTDAIFDGPADNTAISDKGLKQLTAHVQVEHDPLAETPVASGPAHIYSDLFKDGCSRPVKMSRE